MKRFGNLARTVPALAFSALFLVGCVNVPVGDQLIVHQDGRTVRTERAACVKGWLAATSGARQSPVLDPADFGLMIWNVHKAQASTWAVDFARLGAGRDILLFQEAYLTPRFRAALQQPGYGWTMVRAFDLNGVESGVLTASKVETSGACVTRSLEPLVRVPKSALLTRYPLNGSSEELWVANLHGINFTTDTRRYGEQLESVAEILAPHRGPLVLAGDFNDWSESRRGALHGITAALGLLPLKLADDKRSLHFGRPVDHVFHRGLEVVHADTVEVTSSDHNPVRVTFSLPGYPRGGLK